MLNIKAISAYNNPCVQRPSGAGLSLKCPRVHHGQCGQPVLTPQRVGTTIAHPISCVMVHDVSPDEQVLDAIDLAVILQRSLLVGGGRETCSSSLKDPDIAVYVGASKVTQDGETLFIIHSDQPSAIPCQLSHR